MEALEDLKNSYLTAIETAPDAAKLEEIRVAALGKKGEVSLKMRELGKMTPEERRTAGPALNALKDALNSAIATRRDALADAALEARLASEWMDVSLPGRARRQGTIHPVSQVTEEITAIKVEIGVLKTKAGIWGLLGGLIPAAGVIISMVVAKLNK